MNNKYLAKTISLYEKYKSLINYIIFGVVTTISNIITYHVSHNKLGIGNVTSTIIAWVVAVIVAYTTNKIWVFESKSLKSVVLIKEISCFFACRFLTGLLDVCIMWIVPNLFTINTTLLKTISNVIVICLNYVASKLFIFKNTTNKKGL